MLDRRRVRRRVKRTLLCASALVACSWVGTTFGLLAYDGFDWAFVLERGCVFVNCNHVSGSPAALAQTRQELSHAGGIRYYWQGASFGWGERLGFVAPAMLHERTRAAVTGNQVTVSPSILRVPLWLVTLIVGTPTAWLWWHDRRRVGPGQCRHCGYDLTGNVSGRCPECGAAVRSTGGPDAIRNRSVP
jgi:hypothetical protein